MYPPDIPVGQGRVGAEVARRARADDPRAPARGRRPRRRSCAVLSGRPGGRAVDPRPVRLAAAPDRDRASCRPTILPYLRVAGVVPDLGLVATVAVAYREGPETGAIFGFAAGPRHGPLPADPARPLGARRYALTGYFVGVAAGRAAAQPGGWRRCSAGSAGSSAGCCSSGSAPWSARSSCSRSDRCAWCCSPALYDAIVAPIMFPIVGFAARGTEPAYRERGRRARMVTTHGPQPLLSVAPRTLDSPLAVIENRVRM